MKYLVTILLSFTILASCSKKGWNEKDKQEYQDACVESALNAFEKKGAQADTAQIKELCECTADEIMSRGLNSKYPSEELILEITQGCVKKMQEMNQ